MGLFRTMKTNKYTINHRSYSLPELLLRCQKAEHSSLPRWEKEAWTFMAEWLLESPQVQLQTSGSTGLPKMLKIKKQYLRNSARMTLDFLHLLPGDVALLCLSAKHIAGKMMIVRALEGGLNLLLREPNSNPLSGCKEKIDLAAMVPLQVENIMAEGGKSAFAGIKQVIIGGAAVSAALAERIKDLPCCFRETYGMTETVSHIAMRKISRKGASPYFQPMPGVSLALDERSCLKIEAPHLSDKIIISNDVAELSKQGFRLLGRYDNIINSGGIKLLPEEIERKIGFLFKERFFISSRADARLGEKVVLTIETKQPDAYRRECLKTKLLEQLSPFECPKAIFFVEKFKETPSGKIIRE